jgi:surface protein
MKRIILIFILIHTQIISGQTVVLDTNGVTIKWTGTTVPSPYFVQANPRGTGMEWFAIVNNTTKSNITNYAKNIQSGITYFTPSLSSTPIPFNNIVTTVVNNMSQMFDSATAFNQNISSWDVSNVTNMSNMFSGATAFNQTIGSWNVSNVNIMRGMFSGATAFNQPIGSWNMSNVNNMIGMFSTATAFNQPIGNWNVSNVTNMTNMFSGATAFNQNISSWDVSNVQNMTQMFENATNFNQPIGFWNVNNVTSMFHMFSSAINFNQPIGSWNISNVTNLSGMFTWALNFNQDIGSWNISNVTNMIDMLRGIGLSTANYDSLLIGWSTISSIEAPLKPNVAFTGGNSKYCNGTSARSSIISTYGWTITDGGRDPNCVLNTEEFEASILKLYPNPVLNILNIKTDSNLINQPYTIIDGLGRVVLIGELYDIENTINVEQLSKGIYYIKIAGKSANKFIKD